MTTSKMRLAAEIVIPLFFFVLSFLLSSCAGGYGSARSNDEYELEGIASFYAHDFHGRRTANGEEYDMYAMTAAHKTLPFGSVVRVVNLDNNRSTEVRINDRGPFKEGRVIDLSLRAAMELGLVTKGTARVRIEILQLGTSPSQ